MTGYNKVILTGNLTKDPETATIKRGSDGSTTQVTNIRIAVNRTYTVNQQKKEDVCYVDVKSFGKQAEIIAKYCEKGTPLLVDGMLAQDEWTDKTTGGKRSRIYVRLENFRFLPNGNGKKLPGPRMSEGEEPITVLRRMTANQVRGESTEEHDLGF